MKNFFTKLGLILIMLLIDVGLYFLVVWSIDHGSSKGLELAIAGITFIVVSFYCKYKIITEK